MVWKRAVQCLSILDVLLSMMSYAKNSDHEVCRPEILTNVDSKEPLKPFLEIINGYHPCLTKTFNGNFIPNDIIIGCNVNI